MKLRTALLWLAGVRIALGLIAIPLAPFLYKEHFIVLVLLRPTKEVLLAAGFLVSEGKVSWLPVVLAAVPLAVLSVWHFFWLGRLYAKELNSSDMPGLAGRIITPKRVKKMRKALDKRGERLVLLGRAAALSSATIGAAAGGAKMPIRTFLLFDSIGAALSLGGALVAGMVLQEAYDDAGWWLSAVGVAALAAFAFVLGRQLTKE